MQGDPAALQMQTKGVTWFGCRLEPNGGRKKQLLGFLQLLLLFLLQRKEEAWRPLTLVAQALLGMAASAAVLRMQVALGKRHEMKIPGDK